MSLTSKNKDGIQVYYLKDLAEDLQSVHGIDLKEFFESVHGTNFNIVKTRDEKNSELTFTLTTNDERDAPKIWNLKV